MSESLSTKDKINECMQRVTLLLDNPAMSAVDRMDSRLKLTVIMSYLHDIKSEIDSSFQCTSNNTITPAEIINLLAMIDATPEMSTHGTRDKHYYIIDRIKHYKAIEEDTITSEDILASEKQDEQRYEDSHKIDDTFDETVDKYHKWRKLNRKG